MSFLKDMKDAYKQAKQVVQQQQSYRDGPSGFTPYQNSQGGYGPPPGPPPHNPGYSPSYAPPPSGFGTPSGPPPAPQGFNFPTSSSGFPSPGYTPPSGPPQSYNSPHGPPQGYSSSPGPPQGYTPTSGPPQSFNPPSGPPPSYGQSNPTQSGLHPPGSNPGSGYPGQQWHQQHSGSPGYPGQQSHQQQNYHPPPPNGGYAATPPAMQYRPPSGPPPRPPTAVQNYGPHFEGPNHQDAQPYFKYSQCTGKKKALCIGINYFGQQGELKGCINDARNIQRFLCRKFGYKTEDIVMLTDDAQNPRMLPTKANIVQAMRWLVNGAAPNDSLFFHYSGHGGQTKDLDGDEADGYDEVVYPMDHKTNGHIVDDMMHEIMVKPLPAGCRLTAIFDSCHSGSALDLPYIYSTEGKIKEPNLAAEAGQGLLSAVSSYARGDMGGVFKSAMGLVKVASGNTAKADKYARETRTSPADVISWSGCKDSQTSADTHEAGQATGAMSFAFMSVLDAKPQQSYQELLVNIRDILRSKYSQKPQLSSSHPIETNIMFIC